MKQEINVQPIIDGILSKFEGLVQGHKVLRGQNGKQGHVLIQLLTFDDMVLSIDIDMNSALKNKHYFDDLFDNIHNIKGEADHLRFQAKMLGRH